jgi:hypothetical protein
LVNKSKKALKKNLAQWVSLTLKKALTLLNIYKGFKTIWIWLFNPIASSTYASNYETKAKKERFECLHISLTEPIWIHREIPNLAHGKEFRDS